MCLITKIINKVFHILWWLINVLRFKQLGIKSFIDHPLKIDGSMNIKIGNNVFIGYKTWLASKPILQTKNSILQIGNGSSIGHFNHIYATRKIIIGNNVLTADKVYISDNVHGFEDITMPIKNQPIKQKNEVFIGDGSWLGENVCIIGAKIGRNCVIGANSVVTKNIPDYSVAVGAPAKIIKRYNEQTKKWELTKQDGSFIDI